MKSITSGRVVAEEIVLGFEFPRISYLFSLLWQQIIDELEVKVGPYRNIEWKQHRNPFNDVEIWVEIERV